MRARIALVALLATVALVVAPPSSATGAPIRVRVGIGDQSARVFTQPLFRRLDVRLARLFLPWDAIHNPKQMAKARRWVRAARRDHVAPFVHISTNDLRQGVAPLPTVAAYRRSVGALVRALRPLGVSTWGVWDEANHPSQPTWQQPGQVARYFQAMRRFCPRCRIVGLDVLDQRGVADYVNGFFQALPRALWPQARIVGLHNYSDVNRRQLVGVQTILAAARRHTPTARLWITESGGIVSFGRRFPCDEARAADRMEFFFQVLDAFRRSIDRAYVYNWCGTDCSTRMDTGLVRHDGTARPAYAVVRRQLPRFSR